MNGEITVFFSSKNNRQICHNCLPRVQEDFVKIFFWKSSFFHHWALSDFCMSFRRKFVGPFSVLLSVCQFGRIVVKKISSNIFSPIFWTSIANWSVFVRIFFRPSWRHWLLRVQGINLTKEKRFDKSLFVSFIICGPWAKKSRLFSENNRQRCQNGWPRVQGDFLQRIFFSKKFFFYFSIGHWANVFCHFDGSLSVPLSVLFSVCQLDQFLVNKCLSKLFLQHLRTFSKNLSVFFRKSFGQLNKTAFYESRGKFEYKTLFWQRCCLFFSCSSKIERRNNGFLSKIQSANLWHLLTTYPRTFFEEVFFEKVLFFHHWALSNFCMSFRRNFVRPDVSTAFCLSIRSVCGEKIFVW